MANSGFEDKLTRLTEKLTTYPDNFAIHPKVKKLLEQREKMGTGKLPVDYGMAKALAFGSLLVEGIPPGYRDRMPAAGRSIIATPF